MTTSQPQLWVFAGPNGAGKSTLIPQCNVAEYLPVVNADDIAATLRQEQSDKSEPEVIAHAGRRAVERRNSYLAAGQSFGIETTLTGQSPLHLMRTARSLGYRVNLVYVRLSCAELSNSRVCLRVKAGGHDVPERDVFRRFGRSLENLPAAIKISDTVCLLDNSGRYYRRIPPPHQIEAPALIDIL